MIIKTVFATVIFLLSLCKLLDAQPAAIREYFDKVESVGGFHGSVLLSAKGNKVLQRSYGFADIRAQKPNDAATHFNLASVSKIFTSTAIFQLKEKRRLTLDDLVATYLPDFPYTNITLRHLLTHTSGLTDYELFETLVKEYPDTIIHNRNIIPEVKRRDLPLYFAPGEDFRYNNNGFGLLAMVVEKVSGMPFDAYLRRYIFKPAGMSATYVHGLEKDVKTDPSFVTFHVRMHPLYDSTCLPVDEVADYRYTNFNISGTYGESNIITTTSDMLLFDKAFFSGRLVSAASMTEAFTPAKLRNGKIISGHMDTMQGDGLMYQGLGWELFESTSTGFSVGHGGYKFGLATFYCHQISSGTAVIAYSNAPGGDYGGIVTSSMRLLQDLTAQSLPEKRSLVAAYGTALVQRGADEAAAILHFYKRDTAHYYLNEWEMNDLGYNLFYKSDFANHQQLALETFKLATFLFPGSFNPYDSYAQLLAETGHKAAAIKMYKLSVEINPNNEDGKKALQRLNNE